MMLSRIIISILLFFTLFANAQEVVSPLYSNPLLQNKKELFKESKSVISLPFFDDFSYDGHLVDMSLWEESSVFVNRSYPIEPVTLGVATFDGLNKNGLAYDISTSSAYGFADTLTSQEINLFGIDTAYLMFYYQPQGLGDAPQTEDSLFLEFKDINGNWVTKWQLEGGNVEEFKKKVILISSSDYSINNFQFRFRNKATLSGNFDHWHIDYVKLDEFINPNDTFRLNDIAFVYDAPSFLKRYEQMPWTHFKNNEALELNDTVAIFIRNNQASISVNYQYNIFENNNLVTHYPTLGSSRNESVFDYDSVGVFEFKNPPISIGSSAFSSLMPDSVSFLIQHIIETAPDAYQRNDTLTYWQEFNSCFAYDDGIAESAYGLSVTSAKLAYQFKLNRPDTLRAVQMYFPQMLHSVSHIPFKLTVWDDNAGQPGSIIHQQQVYPEHTENGKYHNYYLDSLFQLIGTFYVGWEQNTNDLLNIGLDKNKKANSYMFYNVGAGWSNSSYPGSWMIRPIVSMEEIVLSTNVDRQTPSFTIYPNPAKEVLHFNSNYTNSIINIYNLQGKIVKDIYVVGNEDRINISGLVSGMYIVEVISNRKKDFKKLIIR